MTKEQELESRLTRVREASDKAYLVSSAASHSTANWLLATSTTANSAGFYFAMTAANSWLTVASATCFLFALSATFVCGRFVTTVHAKDAEAADNMRQIEIDVIVEALANADTAGETSSDASDMLDKWTTAAILLTTLGGLLLVVSKAVLL